MSSSSPHRGFLSVVWFPLFFAAAFVMMFLTAFAAPEPHGMRLGVVGDDARVAAVTAAVADHGHSGVHVRRVPDRQDAVRLLRHNQVAGVYIAADHPELLVASAAGGIRADYLSEIIGRKAARAVSGVEATPVDVVPAAKGDVSGVGLFFYALPVLLVGLITSIVLLHAVTWTPWRKSAAIAATGAFTSVFGYAVAVAMDVLPSRPVLLLYAFLLTQAIGWLTTAIAQFAKEYFMPAAMTFVLILGIPTAGGTVAADMLPGPLGALHQVLPFGQFIDLVRAGAYFAGHGALRPMLTLLAWDAAAAALFLWSAHRSGHFRPPTTAPDHNARCERSPAPA